MEKTMHPEIVNPYIVPMVDLVYGYREDVYHTELKKLKMHILRPYTRLIYGDMSDLPKLPILLNIGGGGWRHSTPFFHLPEMTYFANHGYLVATIGYTVSSEGTFPEAIEDVKSAIRFLRKNADKFGADPNRIALIGDSAGGHLAALAGVTGGKNLFNKGDNLDMPDTVSAVVQYYAPIDLVDQVGEQKLGKVTEGIAECLQVFLKEYEAPYHMSTIQKNAALASPIRYVDENTPPFMILQGTADSTVPPAHAKVMYDRLTEVGVEAELIWLEGAEHQDLQFVQEPVLKEVVDFLDKHMK